MPSIDWIELDRRLGTILRQGRLLVIDATSLSLGTLGRIPIFVLDLTPKRAAFEEVLVDAKVGTDTATTKLYDEFEFEQLLYQIEASLLVVARFLAEVHGADAVFAASSNELERGINHRCKLRRLYAYIRRQ